MSGAKNVVGDSGGVGLRALRDRPDDVDRPEAWRAFLLDVIRRTPMPDFGHYGEPYPALNAVVLTHEQHRTLAAITTQFASIFQKATDAVARDGGILERLGFPWVAIELLIQEQPAPLVLGRFDFLLDTGGCWQLLEYNADTPSGPRETVVVEAAITRHLGSRAAAFGRSGPVLAAAAGRVFGDALKVVPGATLGIMTDAGYAEDLAQTVFLTQLLERPLARRGAMVVYGDVDNLHVKRGRLWLRNQPLDALYRYYPFEWLLGRQAFVDIFEAVTGGQLRLLNGLRGLLAQNKGLMAWIWERRDDRTLFTDVERRTLRDHLPPTCWVGDLPPDAPYDDLVLKQVFGREGEEVYFGDALSAAGWARCRAWGTYVAQGRVRASPTAAVIQTSTEPAVRELWPVVGSFSAGGRWAGYYTRMGEPITTGHAKFVATYWERATANGLATMPALDQADHVDYVHGARVR